MATKYHNVIVFGPTGRVGRFVAREASARGAKVCLAMRDTSKAIPGLNESAGQFSRVQADVTDPASVKAAVQSSGAKAAFFYLHPTASDGMKGTVIAMKEAGIEYVVFNSSYSVGPDGPLSEITPDHLIAFMHARVEITLEEVGLPHTALRPGYFAYNVIRNFLDKSKDPWAVVALDNTETIGDCIVPDDIGCVGGALLVDRPSQNLKEAVYIYGPQQLRLVDQVTIISEVLGKDVNIDRQDEDKFRATLLAKQFPPPIVELFIKRMKSGPEPLPLYDIGKESVEKYTGRKSTPFRKFVEEYLQDDGKKDM